MLLGMSSRRSTSLFLNQRAENVMCFEDVIVMPSPTWDLGTLGRLGGWDGWSYLRSRSRIESIN